jgi:cytochrome P450
VIGGYQLRRGSSVMLSQWVVHRDGRWYERPELFEPQRWANGPTQRMPKFAYFPFGGGPRLCIGNSFAMMEAVLVLATLAQRFRFRLVPGHTVTPWPSITLRPKDGILASVERR